MKTKDNECPENCGCKVMIKRNEKDIQRMLGLATKAFWSALISSGSVIAYFVIVVVKFTLAKLTVLP